MIADIQIGALPAAKVSGRLERIYPKARKDGNATLFDVEITVLPGAGVTLRAVGLTPEMLAGLERFGRDVRADGERVSLTVDSDAVLPEISRYLVTQGASLYALTPQRVSLEDLFIQIVGTDGGL